jgi:hypothetical protein
MIRILGQTGRRRHLAQFGTIFTAITLLALIVVPSAQGVLPGSPSNFESGNDPTLIPPLIERPSCRLRLASAHDGCT